MKQNKRSLKRLLFLLWSVLFFIFVCLAAADVFTDKIRCYGILLIGSTYLVFWYLIFQENCQMIDTWLKREVWKE